MKKNLTRQILQFSITSIALIVLFTSCCDCNKSATGKGGSTVAVRDSIPNSLHNTSALYEKFPPTFGPQKFIPDSIVRLGIKLNNEVPCLKDSNGVIVQGFLFDPEDFKKVAGISTIKNLYFQFAISNLKDSTTIRHNPKKAAYTLIIIPLDKDSARIKDPFTGELVAYDFTCPCPSNSSCCPKP